MMSVQFHPKRPMIANRDTETDGESRRLINGKNDCAGSLCNFESGLRARERLMALSNRERDVLHLVVSGLTNKAASLRLGISIKTIEKHRGNLMRKLGVSHVPDLMRVWLLAHPEDLAISSGKRL